jgi:K+-transporting ATPase KdpF subunit
MNATLWLALVLAFGITFYLFYALFRPERF